MLQELAELDAAANLALDEIARGRPGRFTREILGRLVKSGQRPAETRLFSLDLRKLFREMGREERDKFVKALAAKLGAMKKGARFFKSRGGDVTERKALLRTLRSAKALRIARWGWVVRYHLPGQLLTWLQRGTKVRKRKDGRTTGRLRALGVPYPETNLATLATRAMDQIASLFRQWQGGA